MATENNDKKILSLKKQVEDKKKSLKATEKFCPITNCSIEIDGIRTNIQVLNKDQIITLMVKLNAYRLSAKDLGVLNEYNISSYSIDDWITDLKAKLMNIDRKNEEYRLKALESKLHSLLSNDKKVELEIDELEKSI
jgi:hypothetical protein